MAHAPARLCASYPTAILKSEWQPPAHRSVVRSNVDKNRLHRWKWAAAVASIVIALAAAEGLLRLSLFHSSFDFASKDPEYYARTLDELWIYRFLFSSSKRWSLAAQGENASGETRIEFYRNWSTSLMPDEELGYVRRSNVSTRCHETTSMGTRGLREYAPAGPKIAFFGDSFVESAACSDDTLPAKIERLTGIDTLNYGVGGYGVDQMILYFERMLPLLDRANTLFLVGVIQDDFNRLLLHVRTSPKPYFVIDNDRLVLHTEHIRPTALNDFYVRPPERSYLYYFLRGRFDTPVYRSLLAETRDAREQAIRDESRLLFRRLAELRAKAPFNLAFVVFPTPGVAFDARILAQLLDEQIPVVDLRRCLNDVPDTDVYAELHPTSLGNDVLALCLVRDLVAQRLLQ